MKSCTSVRIYATCREYVVIADMKVAIKFIVRGKRGKQERKREGGREGQVLRENEKEEGW